jgi:hypothetical protein
MAASTIPELPDDMRVRAQGIVIAAAKMKLPQPDASSATMQAYLERLREAANRISRIPDEDQRSAEILHVMEDLCWMAFTANRLATDILNQDSILQKHHP